MMPNITSDTLTLLSKGYSVLMMGTLFLSLPNWKKFFLGEKWGGYGDTRLSVSLFQNRFVFPLLGVIWFLSAALLFQKDWTILAGVVNAGFCYYFFVYMRWKGLLRGMGAPGYMSFWLGFTITLLKYLEMHVSPSVFQLALLTIQVDFSLIILSAGVYKASAGYLKNDGLELGLVNPMWGYWWKQYRLISPNHVWIRFLNQSAWILEIVSAVFMLIPQTRLLGAFGVFISFGFIMTQIRLGFLCGMMMLCCGFFINPISVNQKVFDLSSQWSDVLWAIGLGSYLGLRPVALAGLWYNFYKGKSLPGVLQMLLEKYTNVFGIVLWRVFTIDIINFYVHVYVLSKEGLKKKCLSEYSFPLNLRYNHVGESIAVATIFTALKYFPGKPEIFRKRLLRYSKSLSCACDERILFEVWSLRKERNQFVASISQEWVVNPSLGEVTEKLVDSAHSPRNTVTFASAHACQAPGSYVPEAQARG